MNALELTKIKLDQFGDLFHKDPDKLSDQELLSMDFILHRAWSFKRMGHYVRLGDTDWSFDDIINLHAKVRQEMSKRGFHHTIKDELDDQTEPLLSASKDAAPQSEFYFSAEPNLSEETLEEIIISGEIGDDDKVDKGIRQAFGSYGGKRALAHKIASYLPYHKTYVEPFAGGAAVLFAKDYSPKEVINDRDPEIAFMYRFIRDHTTEQRAALAKRNWVINKDTHERLKKMEPANDGDRFYKNYYLTRSSYGKHRGKSFNPANAGVRIDFPDNIERAQHRLKNVKVHNQDYLKILDKYDAPETFFYMDPPYPDKFNLFDFGFDEKSFLKAVKNLKAKWIVSYPSEHASVFKGYNRYRVKRRNQMRGAGGNQEWVTELMASNFPLKPVHLYIEKELEVDVEETEGTNVLTSSFLIHPGEESEEPELEELLEDQEPESQPDQIETPATQEDLEKMQGAFKSPGGKFRLCKKLVSLIPQHQTFVEGFCGGAQVFFHKKRSDEEVLNDISPDLIFAYRFIKNMDSKDQDWLEEQPWVISRSRMKKIYESKPKTPRERFYRIAYLNKSNYWGRTDVLEGLRSGPKGEGYKIQLVKRLPQIQERLQGVKLFSKDWRDVIKDFDGKDTFFYLDPPYPLHWPKEGGGVGSKFFKEEDLLPALKAIKGKFLLSYELEKKNLFKGFKKYRIKTAWTGANQLGHRKKFELLVSNYPIKTSDLYVEKKFPSPSQGVNSLNC